MTLRRFRFGVSFTSVGTRAGWDQRVREAAGLGYDVLQVPDHLGMVAPFPAMAAAAEAADIRVGTYVLNAGVLRPGYLARDVADLHRLTGGRFELGLGTGYVPAEYEAAGVPFGTPADRLRRLETLVRATRELLAAEPDRPRPPLMLAGAGRQVLSFAAREADIVSFPVTVHFAATGDPEEPLASRVALVREAAGDRFDQLELNLFVAGVGDSVSDLDLSVIAQASGKSPEEIARTPGVLAGSPQEIADRLLRYREEYGISYVSVLEDHLPAFAKVIPLLREAGQ